MTFPTVAATNSGNSGANATSHVINMPAGVSVGDRLLVAFCNDGDSTVSVSSGSGWTQLFTEIASLTLRFSAYWKDATGSGDNLTIDTSASQGSAHVSYRITGHDSGTNPAVSAGAGTTDTHPNPDSLNPATWDVEDTLWVAAYGWDGNVSHTSYPANYTSNQVTDRWANSGGVGLALSTRNVAAASEDPGTATLSTSTTALCNTIAVRPSSAAATTRGMPFGNRSTAFNGGRTLVGPLC